MKKKTDRLNTIKLIISTKEIYNQDELLKELAVQGYESTQATLSRDLKQLQVTKATNMNGKLVYVWPNNISPKGDADQQAEEVILRSGFKSLEFSGNIAVIRTRPGYANGIAYDIDSRESADILGTIAGDDTIMLVLRQGVTHQDVRHFLSFITTN